MIAAELNYDVPVIPMFHIDEFLAATKESYEKSLFFKEDEIYKQRNSRSYPWTRRVLEINGNEVYPYLQQGAFQPMADLINSLPVKQDTRTVILISQRKQVDYDFNFHFDREKDYGFRICNGLDTNKTFLEFSKLKDQYVQHARDHKKIENNMVHEKIYSLVPKKSNTVLMVNGHMFPHRVPVDGSTNRFVLIVKGDLLEINSNSYIQAMEE